MQSLKETYSGKKVFITGHTGFKGSWMLQILSMLGAKVKGYALAPETELNLFNELSGAEICESEINDLRNKEALIKSVQLLSTEYKNYWSEMSSRAWHDLPETWELKEDIDLAFEDISNYVSRLRP